MAYSIARHMRDVATGQAGERLHVSLEVVVRDPEALWHAAARIALRQPGMTIADVEDVIGPAEDPMIADCLAMLTAPDALPGCTPLAFSVAASADRPTPAPCPPAKRSRPAREFRLMRGGATKQ